MTGRARGRARAVQHSSSESELDKPGSDPARSERPGSVTTVDYNQSSGESVANVETRMSAMNVRRRYDCDELHTRPAHIADTTGTAGIKIPLLSNLFKLNRMTDFKMFQYHVDFVPDVPNKAMRKSMIQEHANTVGKKFMFDGMILFLPIRLAKDITEVISIRNTDQQTIKISIKLTGEIPTSSPTCMQLYNIIFKRILCYIDMVPIGRNYYSCAQAVRIQAHGLEVWPGFVTSIMKLQNNVMLIADLSHKILHTPTVLDVMYDIFRKSRGDQNFHEACAKKLVGQIVMTRELLNRYNNKTYRVDDIDWDQKPTTQFMMVDKSQQSYLEYYWKNHQIQIQDKDQPLLISLPKAKDLRRGQKGPICLLPELCTLTGLSDEIKSDYNVMKEIAIHTRLGPQERVRTLTQLIERINKNPQACEELQNWNLEFAKSLFEIQGRQLPAEKILVKNNIVLNYNPRNADWSPELKHQELFNAVNLEDWIMFFTKKDAMVAKDLFFTLEKICPAMGIKFSKPKTCELSDDNISTMLAALKGSITDTTQLVLVVLPTTRKDRYDAVKTYCCIDFPVPSQLVVAKTLGKKQMLNAICSKIAMQLNCKMGAELWALDIPLKNIMIVGIDCYSDSSKRNHTVGAFIASMNEKITRFYSRCTFQQNSDQLMQKLKQCMIDALRNYKVINGCLPSKVIVYRDGVGDGQLATIHEQEVSLLLNSFQSLGMDFNPQFVVIIVKKRINSRFFLKGNQGLSNPPPGTVVDTEATRPEWYDFFLVSQSVRQGTVAPTHYNVIYDTTSMKPDHIQRLTYKLTHLYFNWPGTIRVPALCQYAHKMAFLVGQTLHRDPSIKLADKLFFL